MQQLVWAACLLFISFNLNAQQKEGTRITKVYHIASTAGWDYITTNKGKLYVSHGTQVNILNEDTGDSLGYIPNTQGVHGIAFHNGLNRGYTSNGRANNVTVFDLVTNDTLGRISTGENPDAIMFEPFSKMIITCNGRSKDLSVIDPAQNKVIATIPVGGKPEAAVSDGKGRLFVNVEDKSEIVVVSMKDNQVVSRWTVAPGEEPTGLAYDPVTKRLFAACDKKLVILDATNGNNITTLPIGEGCDGVAFDQSAKTIFTSNGEGTVTVIRELNENTFEVIENVPTMKSARTIAIDPAGHRLFLPAAEFETAEAGKRPRMKPGTFCVLVVAY
jgi:YVTN family beta-propeller protein